MQSIPAYGWEARLEKTRELFRRLGIAANRRDCPDFRPSENGTVPLAQPGFPIIHVAGTKGKGSTVGHAGRDALGRRPSHRAVHLAAPGPARRTDGRRRPLLHGRGVRRTRRAAQAGGGRNGPRGGGRGRNRADVFRADHGDGLAAFRAAQRGGGRARSGARRPARLDQRLPAVRVRSSPASASTTRNSWATRWPPSPARRPASSSRACRWSAA